MNTLKRLRGEAPGLAARLPLDHLRHKRRTTAWAGSALLMVVACAAVLPLTVFGSTGPQAGDVFARLSWGDGEGQVGLVRAAEGLTHGPEALAVTEDGRVAILDSVNRRLVLLDTQGQPMTSIRLDLAQPRFLAVDNEALYVLDADSDRTIACYSWSGARTSTVALPQSDQVVTALFATSQGPCVENGHSTSFLVGEAALHLATEPVTTGSLEVAGALPGRPVNGRLDMMVRASFSAADGFHLDAESVDEASMRLCEVTELRPSLAQDQEIEHLLSVDADGYGGLLVGTKLVRPMTQGETTSALAITRLRAAEPGSDSETLQLADVAGDEVLLLAECEYAYLGDPYFVAPDGRIFQPIADASGYTILVHSFGEVQP